MAFVGFSSFEGSGNGSPHQEAKVRLEDGELSLAAKMCGKRDPTTKLKGLAALKKRTSELEELRSLGPWWEANIEKFGADAEWRIRVAAAEALTAAPAKVLRGFDAIASELWMFAHDPDVRMPNAWTLVYPKPAALLKKAPAICKRARERLSLPDGPVRVATLIAVAALVNVTECDDVQTILDDPNTWQSLKARKKVVEFATERKACYRLIQQTGAMGDLLKLVLGEPDPANAGAMFDAVLASAKKNDLLPGDLVAKAVTRDSRFAAAAADRAEDLLKLTNNNNNIEAALLEVVSRLSMKRATRVLTAVCRAIKEPVVDRVVAVVAAVARCESVELDDAFTAAVAGLGRNNTAFLVSIVDLVVSSQDTAVFRRNLGSLVKTDRLCVDAPAVVEMVLKRALTEEDVSVDFCTAFLAEAGASVSSAVDLVALFTKCTTDDGRRAVCEIAAGAENETKVAFLAAVPEKHLGLIGETPFRADVSESDEWAALETRARDDPLLAKAVASSGAATDDFLRFLAADPETDLTGLFPGKPWLEAIAFRAAILRASFEEVVFRAAEVADPLPFFPDLRNELEAPALTTAVLWALRTANDAQRELEPHPWTTLVLDDDKRALIHACLLEDDEAAEDLRLLVGDDSSRLREMASLEAKIPAAYLRGTRPTSIVATAETALEEETEHAELWCDALFRDRPAYSLSQRRLKEDTTPFDKGDVAYYDDRRCVILEVVDEDCFQIRFDDGSERQTVGDRLSRYFLGPAPRVDSVMYCDDDKDGGVERRRLFCRRLFLGLRRPQPWAIRELGSRGLEVDEATEREQNETDPLKLGAWYDVLGAMRQPLPKKTRDRSATLLPRLLRGGYDAQVLLEWLASACTNGALVAGSSGLDTMVLDAAASCLSAAQVGPLAAVVDAGFLTVGTSAVGRFQSRLVDALGDPKRHPGARRVFAAVANVDATCFSWPLGDQRAAIVAAALHDDNYASDDDVVGILEVLDLLVEDAQTATSLDDAVRRELQRFRMAEASSGGVQAYPPRQRSQQRSPHRKKKDDDEKLTKTAVRRRGLAALLVAVETKLGEEDDDDDAAIVARAAGPGFEACLDAWQATKGKKPIDVQQAQRVSTLAKQHGNAVLGAWLAYRLFLKKPGAVREWYRRSVAKDGEAARVLAVDVLKGAAVDRELEAVALEAQSQTPSLDDDSELDIAVSKVTKQVVATYHRDECVIEMVVKYDVAHPLRSVVVDFGQHQGVQEATVRRWALQLRACADHQNTLDAVHRWRASLDFEFKDVEPCPICQGVLNPTSKRLPDVECATCHNKFHTSCLAKWFQSSHKHVCVICQQDFVAIRHNPSASGKKRRSSSAGGPTENPPVTPTPDDELD